MHELDRVRDKIEIRLEPRQVAYLAVGTMVFSGLLFAAGFLLGRNQAHPVAATSAALALEEADSVARAPTEAPADSPAAALGEVEFLFPSVLGARPARARPERRSMRLPASVVAAEAVKPADVPALVVAPTPAPKQPEPRAVRVPEPRAARVPEPRAARVPAPAPEPVAEPEPEPPPPLVAIAPAPEPGEEEDPPDAAAPPVVPAPAAPAPAAEPAPERGRYTLQVKAVQDKAEADAFIADLRRAGYKPHTVLADIPGKGRYYRIRLGRFESLGEARTFQRQYKEKTGQSDAGFVTDL